MLRLILPLYLLAWLLFPHVFAHAEPGSAIRPVKPGLAEEAARRADLIEAQIANKKAQAEYYGKQSEKTGGSGLPAWVVPIISGVISLIGAIYSIRLAAKIAEKNQTASSSEGTNGKRLSCASQQRICVQRFKTFVVTVVFLRIF